MKKFIALAATVALCASAAFAENTIHLGLQFPSANLNVSGFGTTYSEDLMSGNYLSSGTSGDYSSSGAGGNFSYIHVSDGAFTFKFGFGLAGVGTSDILSTTGKNLGGIDFDFDLGFGGAFIHNERMTLSLTADFGLRIKNLAKKAFYEDDEDAYVQNKMTSAMFYLGPELSYTFRFGERVGMFTSLGVFYNVGSSTYSVTTYNGYYSQTGSDKYLTSGFSSHPKFGLSVSF